MKNMLRHFVFVIVWFVGMPVFGMQSESINSLSNFRESSTKIVQDVSQMNKGFNDANKKLKSNISQLQDIIRTQKAKIDSLAKENNGLRAANIFVQDKIVSLHNQLDEERQVFFTFNFLQQQSKDFNWQIVPYKTWEEIVSGKSDDLPIKLEENDGLPVVLEKSAEQSLLRPVFLTILGTSFAWVIGIVLYKSQADPAFRSLLTEKLFGDFFNKISFNGVWKA